VQYKQAWWHYQTCYKVVQTSLIMSWYNKNVTSLTTQGCTNIAIGISWLYRTCWNNLATSLIISTRLLQVVNNLLQTCWQLGTSSANTTCRETCYKMWDFCVCRLYNQDCMSTFQKGVLRGKDMFFVTWATSLADWFFFLFWKKVSLKQHHLMTFKFKRTFKF
jgi:hypothetical protein